MSISPSLRWSILERDGFRCIYCGARGVALEVDHVIPKALGGTNDPDNLVSSCEQCNGGKSASLIRTRKLEKPKIQVVIVRSDANLQHIKQLNNEAAKRRHKYRDLEAEHAQLKAEHEELKALFNSLCDQAIGLVQ